MLKKMNENHSWANFYEKTKNVKPSELTLQAIELAPATGKALDLGGGNMRDVPTELNHGLEVWVVDGAKEMVEVAKKIKNDDVHVVNSYFEDYKFPENEFNFVNAISSLPFVSKDALPEIFKRIKLSMTDDAVFCANLFGDEHGWAKSDDELRFKITFLSEAEVRELLKDFQIVSFEEVKKESKPAVGQEVFWHEYRFIVKK